MGPQCLSGLGNAFNFNPGRGLSGRVQKKTRQSCHWLALRWAWDSLHTWRIRRPILLPDLKLKSSSLLMQVSCLEHRYSQL